MARSRPAFGKWLYPACVGPLRGWHALVAAAVAAVALLVVPAAASATSPVLEFVVPGKSLPVSFTSESGEVNAAMAGFETIVHCAASHGEGNITGARSAVAEYAFMGCVTEKGHDGGAKCKSAEAGEGEIRTGPIEARLVYIDQARREVGILLNPGGGTYMVFECGGESAEGSGAFLASVGPVDEEATSFTATLSQADAMQTPDEYEDENGERREAIPTGVRGGNAPATTGVQAVFTVHSSAAGEIRAITSEEVEAKQQEEARQREQKQQQEEAAKTIRLEEEAPANRHGGVAVAAAHTQLPTLSVVKSKIVRGKLVLTLRISKAGVLTVSGHGVRRVSKALSAGLHRLEVRIAASARNARGHRHATKITVRLRVASVTVSRTLKIRL